MTTLPSVYLTLGFEPAFNRLMSDTNEFSEQMWDKNNKSTGMHSFTATLGSTLLIVPIALFSAAENVLKLPLVAFSTIVFELPLATVGYTVRLLSSGKFGQTLIDMQKEMPGLLDLIYTTYKIVGFVFAAAATLTLGMLSTYLNYRLHRFLGLVNPALLPAPEKVKISVPCQHGEAIAKLNNDLSAANVDIDAKKASIIKLEQEITQYKALKETIETKEAEITRLQTFEKQVAELQSQLKTLQEEKQALAEKLKVQSQPADVEALKQKVLTLESQQKELERQLAEKVQELAAKNSAAPVSVPTDPQLAQLPAQFDEYKVQIAAAFNKLKSEKRELESKLAALQASPASPAVPNGTPGSFKNPVKSAFDLFGKFNEEKKAVEQARDAALAKAKELEMKLSDLQIKKEQADQRFGKLEQQHSQCAATETKELHAAEAARAAAEKGIASTREEARLAAEAAKQREADLSALLTAEKEKAANLQRDKETALAELQVSKTQLEAQKKQLENDIRALKKDHLEAMAAEKALQGTTLKQKQTEFDGVKQQLEEQKKQHEEGIATLNTLHLAAIDAEKRYFAEKLKAMADSSKAIFSELFPDIKPEAIAQLITSDLTKIPAEITEILNRFKSFDEQAKKWPAEQQALIQHIQELQQREHELIEIENGLRDEMDARRQAMASETAESRVELLSITDELKALQETLKQKQLEIEEVQQQLKQLTDVTNAKDQFQADCYEGLIKIRDLEAELAQYKQQNGASNKGVPESGEG